MQYSDRCMHNRKLDKSCKECQLLCDELKLVIIRKLGGMK